MKLRNCLSALLLAVLLQAAGPAAALAVAYVDLADAYERSTALQALIGQVDARLTAIRAGYERDAAPLLAEIEALKSSRMHEAARLERKRQLLLQLAELEQAAARQQQAIAKANQKASASVDVQIALIEEELRKQHGLQALFRTQDLLFHKPGSALDLSAELYRRLNEKLPAVALELPEAEPAGK